MATNQNDEDKQVPVYGAAITNQANAVAAPTQAEFNSLVGKFNALLAAVREANIIQLD